MIFGHVGLPNALRGAGSILLPVGCRKRPVIGTWWLPAGWMGLVHYLHHLPGWAPVFSVSREGI
jgi:hypothetical protein